MTGRFGQRGLIAALALALVAGCSSGDNKSQLAQLAKGSLSEITGLVRGGQPKQSPAESLTRAKIADVKAPLMRVKVERAGATGLMTPMHLSATGEVIWRTADGVSMTIEDGLLVATRALGDDLMSATTPIVQASGSGTRIHSYLDGDDSTYQVVYRCDFSAAPAEVVVLERLYRATRYEERCRAQDRPSSFTNEYWVDGGGKLRKSRQFVSDRVGYVTLEQLVD